MRILKYKKITKISLIKKINYYLKKELKQKLICFVNNHELNQNWNKVIK